MVKSAVTTTSGTSARRARAAELSRDHLAATFSRQTTPVVAGEDLVPLLLPLQQALGVDGLRRGNTVLIGGEEGSGATSLALALIAKATTDGMWCSIVGPPDLGVVAAVELGVDLERLVVVASPRTRAATAIGALVEGCDVVLLRLPLAMSRTEMLRLGARARQRRVLIVLLSDPRSRAVAWPEAPDITVQIRSSAFYGIESGSGRIAGRRVAIETMHRRSGGLRAPVVLWLPSVTGELRLVDEGEMGEGNADHFGREAKAMGEVAIALHPESAHARRAASQ
jgi:recA bacterial DNA recombination protein